MTVIIRHEGCNDGMSDSVEADTVQVKGEDFSFHGCGGPIVLPRHIAGSSWDIMTVNGETIPYVPNEDTRKRSELFAVHWQLNSTVHANFGCGLLIGRYRAGGGRITPTEQLARRAGGTCEHEAFERQVLAILGRAGPGPVGRGRRDRAQESRRDLAPQAALLKVGTRSICERLDRSMKKLLALAPLFVLTSCLTHPAPPPAPYRALGTEPFWNLLIDPINLTFTQPDAQPILQRTPNSIIGVAGEIYQTPRINVNIVHARCSDGMSDRIYPDTVQVTVDGQQFKGCGGL